MSSVPCIDIYFGSCHGCFKHLETWWRHQRETLSALLALCEGNPPVTGGFPSQTPVARSIGVFFNLRQKKRLSKQLRRRWFGTPLRSIWRHCNEEFFITFSISRLFLQTLTLTGITHHLQVPHICVAALCHHWFRYGLSSRHQAISKTNDEYSPITHQGTNFEKMLMLTFTCKIVRKVIISGILPSFCPCEDGWHLRKEFSMTSTTSRVPSHRYPLWQK